MTKIKCLDAHGSKLAPDFGFEATRKQWLPESSLRGRSFDSLHVIYGMNTKPQFPSIVCGHYLMLPSILLPLDCTIS